MSQSQTPLVKSLTERFADMKTWRSVWDSHFDEIQALVRPHTRTFNSGLGGMLRGDRRHDRIFDGTAAWSLEQFAAGLSSYLTSAGERWFSIGFRGLPTSDLPHEIKEWMEVVSDIIYHIYSLPETNHTSALHETYLDIGAFGTSVLLQEESTTADSPVLFTAWPLADCWVTENSRGIIDVCFRRYFPTTRTLIQQFPQIADTDQVTKSKMDKTWECVHAVFPRSERIPEAKDSRNKKFASVYFCEEFPDVLSESGFDEFPYHAPRWAKLSGEMYGRSPAMSVLPDIKMLNQMVKEIIFSAQLSNRPPFIFDDDAMLHPVKSIVPGSILYKQQGAATPEPLMSGSQPMLSLEMVNELRDAVRRAFFIDFLLRPKKKERQTTVEIMDDRNEMLRQMGPMIARLQSELLGPMIKRTVNIAKRMNLLPDMPPLPDELRDYPLDIVYTSPAAKAQYGSKVGAITQYIQDVGVLAQFDPSVLQMINMPELMSELAKMRDVTVRVIKDPKTLKREQEAAQQQQQMQQMMEAAPQVTGAIKDVAQARQADPTLLDGML